MDRAALERFTVEQLRQEAARYRLPTTGKKIELIETIVSHLEDNGPVADLLGSNLGQVDAEDGAGPQNRPDPVEQTDVLRQMVDALQSVIRRQDEEREEQRRCFQEQQRQLGQLLEVLSAQRTTGTSTMNGAQLREDPVPGPSDSPERAVSRQETPPAGASAWATGGAIQALASQIPEFSGKERDDVRAWARRIDKIIQVHGVNDAVALLAASSRLSGSARRWYDIQGGTAIESWTGLRDELIKIFDQRVPFYKVMQKIDSRRWLPGKETFDEYAIDKLALIHRVDLPDKDKIHLLIGGISLSSLRGTALSLGAPTVDGFLEDMRRITQGIGEQDRKPTVANLAAKPKDESCRNCGKKGHGHKECRGEVICFYCKEKGHRRLDCPLLKKKDGKGQRQTATSAVAAGVAEGCSSEDVVAGVVATVQEGPLRLVTGDPVIDVDSLLGKSRQLAALIDTGSPVSFIKHKVFANFVKSEQVKLNPTDRTLKNLSDQALEICGTVKVKLTLRAIPGIEFSVFFFVLKNDSFNVDLILGRDFFREQKLTLVWKPLSQGQNNKVELFAQLPLCVEEQNNSLEQTISNLSSDYGCKIDKQLKMLIRDIGNKDIVPVEDDYCVKVRLNDDSVYAYAPRRYAHTERLQMREITDDLLQRGIIRPSVSPYCARVVPVRKKNGTMRLCVGLRPLNSKVVKQKYPFPVIEDCLARLGNNKVFTLLDLKDSFHQIKVHEDSRKYFSFATPDGQFEYNRLPFGYCEAPAEFQKRLIQILSPLIREDKVIVYIDDVLIPTETVEENLEILKEVMIILKKYRFVLNIPKCKFLRRKIEFLGYIISEDGLTLSPRHTEAVKNYKQPEDRLQLQRFLGLVNYFRKFIKNFAIIAQPLQNLLRKDTKFDFNDECVKSFIQLKKKLTSTPVLRLYNPAAETQLHTDACCTGLGAILLQKQDDQSWAPVAYYSQTTNKSEKNYHSYELEMLAVVRAVERFHLYLYGLNFTIITDCNAIVYAVKKANLNPRIARWTLALQNYTFNITHRPGSRMSHVDALSRSVAYVNELPLERELEFRQLADPRIQEIVKDLEMRDNDRFSLLDGLVYRKENGHMKFVLPESMLMSIMRAHHDDMAHCGAEKTLFGIKQHYWFPSMRKKTYDYIENCLTCLMANDATNRFEGETALYPLPSSPMQILHADHLGPLQETPENFKHILVIVDAYTRFTWLFATKSTSFKETISHMGKLFNTFGKPTELVTDRGTAFTSREFTDFTNNNNVKHRKIAVAAPWANGMVERANRFIKTSLTKLLQVSSDWNQYLDSLQYIINNTYHSSIKSSPAKLLFGFDQRSHTDSSFAKYTQVLANVDSDLETERNESRAKALQATNELRNYNKDYKDKRRIKPSVYNKGDYVLIRDTRHTPGVNSKLKPKYKGPYMVAKSLSDNRYVIQDIPGFNIKARPLNTILSSDRIKPWVKLSNHCK